MSENYDPFSGFDTIITVWVQTVIGTILNLAIILIFLPGYLSLPIVQPELLVSMSRATFIVLTLAGAGFLLSGYFSFILYVIGPYVLIKLLIKKINKRVENHEAAKK